MASISSGKVKLWLYLNRRDINISQLGGSGGGSKFFAQGGCAHVDDLVIQLDQAYKNILQLLL